VSAPEQPPPFDPAPVLPTQGGTYELDPETGELTTEEDTPE
jgi:hypothetical protein